MCFEALGKKRFRLTAVLHALVLLVVGGTTSAAQISTTQPWLEDTNAQYIIFAQGTLQDNAREFAVPVEAKTFRLQFWSRMSGDVTFEIIGPGGKPQSLTEPNVNPTVGKDRSSVVVFDPRPGLWKIRVRGNGSFTAGVTTQSELYVCCLGLVSAAGQQGQPLPPLVQLRTRLQAMQVSLAGFEVKSVEFHLVDENDQVIQPVKMRQNDFSNPYLMNLLVEVPARSFRIRTRGIDQTGYTFQRTFATLFQPPAEPIEGPPAQDKFLGELAQQAEAGPYQVVRASVIDVADEGFLSERGTVIGLRLKYSLQFPRDGFYSPVPQVYPERINSGYTGALSLKTHRVTIEPRPEGLTSSGDLRYISRAMYRGGQVYRFTIDLIPNYAIYLEPSRSFCIAVKTFAQGTRDRFYAEVTSDARLRFRYSISGTDYDGRQPVTTDQAYIPNSWYQGYLRDGAVECQ